MKVIGAIIFLSFLGFALALPGHRKNLLARTNADWLVDLSSAFTHFFIAPLLQVTFTYGVFRYFFPELQGAVSGSLAISLGLYAIVDYAWYWNHRLFHGDPFFWKLHRAHHSPKVVDVLSTSRNPFITHFFRVYLWLVGLFVYLLADPGYFLWVSVFGSAIIFWGHTPFCLPADSQIEKMISRLLVTPRQHLWHHSRGNPNCNFGSVFSLWDRIHGTLFQSDGLPLAYGESVNLPILKQLLWPF